MFRRSEPFKPKNGPTPPLLPQFSEFFFRNHSPFSAGRAPPLLRPSGRTVALVERFDLIERPPASQPETAMQGAVKSPQTPNLGGLSEPCKLSTQMPPNNVHSPKWSDLHVRSQIGDFHPIVNLVS